MDRIDIPVKRPPDRYRGILKKAAKAACGAGMTHEGVNTVEPLPAGAGWPLKYPEPPESMA